MAENKHWRTERDADGIAWLHFDMAETSTNVLSVETIAEFDAHLRDIESSPPKGLVILSDKKSGFIAGADIKGFTSMESVEQAAEFMRGMHTVLNRLESFPFPTLSLISGFCLGGGMELALATRYRIANEDPKTRLGLPEVRLGIHPGFGGTVRAPRLVGAPTAMDMMLSGRALSARAAQKVGLIDYAVPERQLLRAAKMIITEAPAARRPGRLARLSNHPLVRPLLAKYLKRSVAKKANPDHYPAPYAMIDLWCKHFDNPNKMYAEEALSVANLVVGDTAQSLIRVFFLQEEMKALGRKNKFHADRVHVVGAGVMGGDIAAWCALRGLHVTLQDQSPERIAPAIKRAHALFKKKLRQPRLIQAAMDRLMPDVKGLGVERADVIIEAIFENAEAKQNLYRALEPRMKPTALLTTNTSSIPLEVLSEALENPKRLVGLHFFNPVAQMQLVEIVKGEQTSQSIVNQAAAFARQIDRLPLPVKSSPGFLVNRILMPYLLEAVVLESEGVSPELIDKAATDFGMPMGPIELADTVGLDICLAVAETLAQSLDVEIPAKLRSMVSAGDLGRKSGKGFYSYNKGKPEKAKQEGTSLPADLTDRMMFRMLNESMACLREGVVESADLLDAGVIFGTGFAPFRGGPMHHIHASGSQSMKNKIDDLSQKYDGRFEPDAAWGSL